MVALSRLMLDNVPNVKAYWIMYGMPTAAVALHFGANDVQGTVVREQIFQAAGATSGTEQKVTELVRFIRALPRLSEADISRMESLNPRSPDEIRREIADEQFLQGGSVAPAPPAHAGHEGAHR